MSFLILYIAESEKFDEIAARDSITRAGANIVDGIAAADARNFLYISGDDYTRVRISDDLETIFIDGAGIASFDIAVRIQNGYPRPIHLVDDGYTFDIPLSEFVSATDLMAAAHDRGA